MDTNQTKLIDVFEPKRVATRGKVRKLSFISIPFFIVAVVCFLIGMNSYDGNNPIMIGFFVGLVVGIILIAISFKIKSNFSKSFIKEFKKIVFDKYFPGWKLNEKYGMNQQEIMFPGFFSNPDRFYSSEYMSGTYEGMPFKSSKYKLERREVHHSKNGTTVTYVPYAEGTMYFFDFQREFGQTVKILERNGYCGSTRGLKKCETEFIQFNKKFQIYASDEAQVFYLLTPQIQEKIMKLEPMFKGSFLLAFIGSDLWLAVNDSGQSIKVDINKPLTEEKLYNIEMLLATPKLIIDNLGLNKTKFKKNAGVDIN